MRSESLSNRKSFDLSQYYNALMICVTKQLKIVWFHKKNYEY